MTSLYDQFHSNTNIDHVYNLLYDIFIKKYEIDIKKNQNYITYYNNKLREIFIKSEKSTIEGLNRELLTHHIKYFVEDIKTKKVNSHILERPELIKNEEKDLDKTDVISTYNSLLEMRQLPGEIDNKSTPINNTELSFDDLISKNNDELSFNDLIIEKSTPIKLETLVEQKQTESPTKNINADIKESKPNIIISSSNRLDKKNSKFNYKVKNINEINKLLKLIIPIEKSLHFSSPILKLIIPEFRLELLLTCKSTYDLNNYKMGIYEPEEHSINYNRLSDDITIIIQSIYDDSDYDTDIETCNILDNNIIIEDTSEYKIDDILCIYSDDKEFQKIVDIKEDKLIMECIDTVTDKDTYIMNMNLQHNLIFV